MKQQIPTGHVCNHNNDLHHQATIHQTLLSVYTTTKTEREILQPHLIIKNTITHKQSHHILNYISTWQSDTGSHLTQMLLSQSHKHQKKKPASVYLLLLLVVCLDQGHLKDTPPEMRTNTCPDSCPTYTHSHTLLSYIHSLTYTPVLHTLTYSHPLVSNQPTFQPRL